MAAPAAMVMRPALPSSGKNVANSRVSPGSGGSSVRVRSMNDGPFASAGSATSRLVDLPLTVVMIVSVSPSRVPTAVVGRNRGFR